MANGSAGGLGHNHEIEDAKPCNYEDFSTHVSFLFTALLTTIATMRYEQIYELIQELITDRLLFIAYIWVT